MALTYSYDELDLCPMCLNLSVVGWLDENEMWHLKCKQCGWRNDFDDNNLNIEENKEKIKIRYKYENYNI
jgi:Zn ribbon nucleic-acid-binding protein